MSLLHKISLKTPQLLAISFIPAQILETLRRPLCNKRLPCTAAANAPCATRGPCVVFQTGAVLPIAVHLLSLLTLPYRSPLHFFRRFHTSFFPSLSVLICLYYLFIYCHRSFKIWIRICCSLQHCVPFTLLSVAVRYNPSGTLSVRLWTWNVLARWLLVWGNANSM